MGLPNTDDYYELLCYELRDALRPFAARTNSESHTEDTSVPDDALCVAMSYTAGNYRKARSLLKGK